jgi:hypothetical protein
LLLPFSFRLFRSCDAVLGGPGMSRAGEPLAGGINAQ